MTLAELQALRDATIKDLDLLQVQNGEFSLTKVADRRQVLAILDAEIAAANAAAGVLPIRQIRLYSDSKGFD